jgi:PAS domain S-box-containing protein
MDFDLDMDGKDLAPNVQKLLQDLNNHKVELELQEDELIRTSQDLTAAQRRFAELRDNAPVAYFLHDMDGFLLEINKRARNLFGLKPFQKNVYLSEVLMADVLELFEFHVRRSKTESHACSIELKLPRIGGDCRHVLAETTQTQPNVFQTVMVDVTDQRKSERIRERLDSDLHQTQKMQVLDQLSGGIAHDFNNILQVLVMQTELALSEISDSNEPALEIVNEIAKTATRGTELTRRLLAFSRKAPLEKVRGDINHFIENSLSLISRSLGENIQIVFNREPECLGVWADAVQIEQALLNLCLNSRDAMPEQRGQITITTSKQFFAKRQTISSLPLSPGPYAKISISDEGSGIRNSVLPRIFEPFYTTKDVGKGTGLGMSIVYSIAKQHNGSVEVSASSEQGTTIDFYLPRFQLPVSMTAPVSVQSPVSSKRPIAGCVLVCDDEPAILEVISRMLKRLGLNVLAASNGQAAVELIEAHDQIELLLTDVVMPEKDGRQICKSFLNKFPDQPVVFMSGHGDSVLDQEFLSENNATFIGKPFRVDTLEKKLGLHLFESVPNQ